jgi:hypothetical protein
LANVDNLLRPAFEYGPVLCRHILGPQANS